MTHLLAHLRAALLFGAGLAVYALVVIGLAKFCSQEWHPDGHHGRQP